MLNIYEKLECDLQVEQVKKNTGIIKAVKGYNGVVCSILGESWYGKGVSMSTVLSNYRV